MTKTRGEGLVKTLPNTERGFSSDDELFAELAAHNTDYDGCFFVGVSSTGIYCRTVCTAKVPRRENCTFFPTAAMAEAAGYRPCMKCRPELAPDTPGFPGMATVAYRAAGLIKKDSSSCSVADVARALGVSERQLRRIFEDEYGVSPAAYRNTCRLLLAKGLLTDTDMPVTRVAYACGFSSVRRFNDAFSKQYRMPPSRLRNRAPAPGADVHPIEMRVDYRPPFRFDLLLEFLGVRAIEGVEVVRDGAYWRSVKGAGGVEHPGRPHRPDSMNTAAGSTGAGSTNAASAADSVGGAAQKSPGQPPVGWIRVADFPQKNCLKVTVSPDLFDEIPSVISKVRRLFDVDCTPRAVEAGLADFYARVPQSRIPGIRVPCSFDGFEMAVRAILGQQVTVKAANTMAGRVAQAFGTPAHLPVEGLRTAFPSPLAFCAPDAAERLGQLGVVRQRARAICTLAEALCAGELDLRPEADVERSAARLLEVPGIGEWTVQYLLMRAFDYPDAFPATDYGVKCAFPDMKEKALKELSLKWSPWRSYAVMSLWSVPHGS
ncbi:MAG: helix-turn-helix domain-containing protein [Coriobacteriaceae bacterium]|jgi:AraC family transcriptional regulator of adaptative response / DNA-3-methyladenine glycosylase II|nr:helix-turn-helix domain-containing protein [Coriobacteriaceae bacterium]